LAPEADFGKLEPVYEALRCVRRELDAKNCPDRFFCCSALDGLRPYMVAGQGTPDQAPARMMAYRHPGAFAKIIDVLVENSIQYLVGQLKAGRRRAADFRHLGPGVLPPREFCTLVDRADPVASSEGVRKKVPGAKIIGFPRGAGALLPGYVETTCVDAVSIDWAARAVIDPRARAKSRRHSGQSRSAGADRKAEQALDLAVDDVLENFAKGRLIFKNLGHGIQPETPIAHVEQMLQRCAGV